MVISVVILANEALAEPGHCMSYCKKAWSRESHCIAKMSSWCESLAASIAWACNQVKQISGTRRNQESESTWQGNHASNQHAKATVSSVPSRPYCLPLQRSVSLKSLGQHNRRLMHWKHVETCMEQAYFFSRYGVATEHRFYSQSFEDSAISSV